MHAPAPTPRPDPVAPPAPVAEVPVYANRAPRQYDWLAGLLGLAVPGLGQMFRGRTAKGVLFFVCLNALFFYGFWLGQGRNVYLPVLPTVQVNGPKGLQKVEPNLFDSLWARQQYAGQFFVGVGAWPAAFQYAAYDPQAPDKPLPLLGALQQAPTPADINEMQRASESKLFDLAWVYTVIAGVMNLLVVYDAAAGPAFREIPRAEWEELQRQKGKRK